MPGCREMASMVKQGLIEPTRTTDDRVSWSDRSGGRILIQMRCVSSFVGV